MSRDSGSEQPTQRTVAELLAEYGGSGSSGSSSAGAAANDSGDDSGGSGQRNSARRRRRRAEDPSETAPQAIIDRVLSDSGKLRPIDPDGEPPARRGHRADSAEPAESADSAAGEAPAADAESGSGTSEQPAGQQAAVRGDEQPAQPEQPAQSAKPGKANYWARRFAGGKKGQSAPHQQAAQSPPTPDSSEATGRMTPPVAQPPQPDQQYPQADQYPQQAGEVDPEATLQQPALPQASAAPPAQQPPPQQPAAQQPAAQQPAARPASPQEAPPASSQQVGAPDAPAVDGATEQLPPVRPQPRPDDGGTTVLPPASAAGTGTAYPVGPYAGEVTDYPDEAEYLGEFEYPVDDGYPADGYAGREQDYDDYDALDGYPDDYADDDYDPDLPAGMAAADYRDDYDDDVDEPASTRREWVTFAGQTVAALVAGGLVWVAFRWLWSFFAPAALVVALVVTGCLVLVARRYARTDDLQSILFSVLVGLVCTVSPAALLLISH